MSWHVSSSHYQNLSSTLIPPIHPFYNPDLESGLGRGRLVQTSSPEHSHSPAPPGVPWSVLRSDEMYNLSSVLRSTLWASDQMDMPGNPPPTAGILIRGPDHINWFLLTRRTQRLHSQLPLNAGAQTSQFMCCPFHNETSKYHPLIGSLIKHASLHLLQNITWSLKC